MKTCPKRNKGLPKAKSILEQYFTTVEFCPELLYGVLVS